MAAIVLGEIGSRVNLRMANGAAFPPYRLAAAFDDGTPINLSGTMLRAVAWLPAKPDTIVQQLVVTVVDAAAGVFDLSLPKADVSKLCCLDVTRLTAPFLLEWALYLDPDSQTDARRLFYGMIMLYTGARP